MNWFKFDLRNFLCSLHKNNLAFKYFSNKKFFNFLKKKQSIYNLIVKNLYTYQNSHHHNSFSLKDPLKLTDLAKLKVKSTIAYLDMSLINRLSIPKHMNQFISAELSPGLGNSYKRAKMNIFLKISS